MSDADAGHGRSVRCVRSWSRTYKPTKKLALGRMSGVDGGAPSKDVSQVTHASALFSHCSVMQISRGERERAARLTARGTTGYAEARVLMRVEFTRRPEAAGFQKRRAGHACSWTWFGLRLRTRYDFSTPTSCGAPPRTDPKAQRQLRTCGRTRT